ncbi:hypothetical protein CUJ84_Chr003381 [Rhizobium leguminosarum]|uniref:Uncharacterized protein n=1 Tax=Rhizobium leguminosarum TaxID=384 RepID=A0A2K9Z648_RHILE|nr:hypothetical protein CUJ84_Chr003381 [Rhizobium leguminosarum]
MQAHMGTERSRGEAETAAQGIKKGIQGRNPHYRRKIAPLGITAGRRTYSKIFILALLAGD